LPPDNAAIQHSVPQSNRNACNQFKLTRHPPRIDEGPDVMLNEATLVAHPGCSAESIFQGSERACPPRKIDDRGPNHDRYVNPRPPWVDQHPESAEDSEQNNSEMNQEHNVCGESIHHGAMPMRRLSSPAGGWRSLTHVGWNEGRIAGSMEWIGATGWRAATDRASHLCGRTARRCLNSSGRCQSKW